MLKRLSAFLVALAVAAPAFADLRYTTRLEARAIPTDTAPNPIVGLIGGLLVTRLPVGTATTYVGADAVRVEFAEDAGVFPAGTILLIRGGAISVLNPRENTYWTVAPTSLTMGLSLTPQVTTARTGDITTIAGVPAERTTFGFSIDLPMPAGLRLPPDLPSALSMEGEMWVTDRFREYGAAIGAAAGASAMSLGLGMLPQDGFVVRQITRSALLGYEVELNVSDIQETPDTPARFQIPDGFREVPPPQPAGLPR